MGNQAHCNCRSSPRNLSVRRGTEVGYSHCRRVYNNKGKLSTTSDLDTSAEYSSRRRSQHWQVVIPVIVGYSDC